MKAAFVGLVGRPSCGKSTLINRICGHKVSIVTPVPQTTRNRVRGIYNAAPGQLVFVDTPGFHLSDKKMNLHLKELAVRTLAEVDLTLYLIDSSRPPGQEEQALADLLKDQGQRLVVGLNKSDLPRNHTPEIRRFLQRTLGEPRIQPLSALTGQGVQELLAILWELAPQGQQLYPEEYYTDQSPEFRIAEIVREKAVLATREEVPHSLYVEISDMEMKEEASYLWVRGFIYVDRESQKGIVVGRGGEKIKTIVREAERELAELFPYPVRLDIRVKTRPRWIRNEALLRRIIS